jgi:hypothetical protein
MVQVTLELALIAIGFILVLGLMLESRMRLNETVIEVQEQLDLMERAIEVVGTVLTRIPELVPSFSINQSPLGQILEFFQGMNAPPPGGDGSYDAPQLRDDVGQFSDGSTEEATTVEPE